MTLSDIFNGAVGYVRANPKPTLGLTTVVVLITTILGFIVDMATPSIEADTDPESLDVLTAAIGSLASATASLLATVLLSGMLTVVVARAVLGIRITVGETWQRVRGRIPALFGLVLAEIAASLALIAAVALTVYGVYRAAGGMVATLVGAPLVLLLIAGLAYAWTVLALAPVAIVLERRSLLSSIKRSFDLARNRFWRILGIRALAGVVAALVAGAVSIPFLVVGQVLAFGSGATSPSVTGVAIANVGGAIGQILTTPFLAGVVTLLYIDARIRSEAFDLILLSTPPGSADADSLWLPR